MLARLSQIHYMADYLEEKRREFERTLEELIDPAILIAVRPPLAFGTPDSNRSGPSHRSRGRA